MIFCSRKISFVFVIMLLNSINILASDYTFSDIAVMKSKTGVSHNQTASLTGYRNTNDGGEGEYKFDANVLNDGDEVIVVKSSGSSGAWIRQPTDTSYTIDPTDLSQPIYLSWLDPDTTANYDCRNKLQLAIYAARTRAGSGIGKLYITPGNFKIESTMPIACKRVSIEGLPGHKLWNSLPSDYTWDVNDYDGNDHSYTATNVINSSGSAQNWTATYNGMPWNGKTLMFTSVKGISSSQRLEIKNLVVDFGWGTTDTPGTVDNITGLSDQSPFNEFIYYQGFSGGEYTDYIGCTFSNSPGAYLEGGLLEDVAVRYCTFYEYGDHVFYFGGSEELLFENNTIIGTRSQVGTITNGIPSSNYVGLTTRNALKYRGCQGITIRDNIADIPYGYFCYFETSDAAGQTGDCGGYSDTQRAQVVRNRVKCKYFMGAHSFRTRPPLSSGSGPFYSRFIDFIDNSIEVSSYLVFTGGYTGNLGNLRDCTFARNGIEVNNSTGWIPFTIFGCPDQDYKELVTDGLRPIGNIEFISNNVYGGINFEHNGSVGKIYVAHNTIDASDSNQNTGNELFRMANCVQLANGETGYLPRHLDYIYCCDNELINYFAYVLQNGTYCSKSWIAGDYGYDSTTFYNITGYPTTSTIIARSIVYSATGSGTKLYINKQDCTSSDTSVPESDPTRWEAAVRQPSYMYCKNNILRNDLASGHIYDLYQWEPTQLEFYYEGSGNTVTSLDGTSRSANHYLNGGITENLTDEYIDSAGTAQLQPSDIPNFPYGALLSSGNLSLWIEASEPSGQIAYDSSYSVNDGTLIGDASLGDGVLTLDGSGDYVNCGKDSSLEMGTQDITITARIKLDSVQNTYNGIVTKGAGSATDAGYALLYRPAYNGSLLLILSNGTTSIWISSNTGLNLTDNQWHTIGVSVVRSGNATFYVDGIAVGGASVSSLSSDNIVNQNKDLLIGSWAAYWDIKGQIDSVMIHKYALTQTQIVDLYGKKLNMQFSENFGNPLDSSRHSNDGTLVSDASLDDGVLTLDGAGDYVNCGKDSSLDMGTQDMTITARIKLDSTQKTYNGIVTKGAGSSTDAGYALLYRPAYNGSLLLILSNGTTSVWASSNINLNINDDQWYTIGVSVVRNGNATFYVDGIAVGGTSVSSFSSYNIVNQNKDLQIGSWAAYWDINGQIDNVKIYSRALTEQEISADQ